MKTKMVLILAFAALLGAGAMWSAQHGLQTTTAGDHKILYYACPMHPNIKYDKPGDCPACGMKLQPVYADTANTNAPAATPAGCCSTETNATSAASGCCQ